MDLIGELNSNGNRFMSYLHRKEQRNFTKKEIRKEEKE